MMFLFLVLSLCVPSQAERQCKDIFESETSFEFDADIRIDTKNYLVTFQERTFHVRPLAFELLQLILNAPDEVISTDDLIRDLWGLKEPEGADATLKVTLHHLRQGFKSIDPKFDRIGKYHGKGVYWKRAKPRIRERGKLCVGIHFPMAFYEDQELKLTHQEWLLVKMGVEKGFTRNGLGTSFPVVLCNLNAKFKKLTGQKLFVRDGERYVLTVK